MSEAQGGNTKKCILAVDDTAIILTRISEILCNDYEVITANSGVRAMKFLKERKPDLILLDIKMSPMDGIETLQEIRSRRDLEDIPVIMLTGVEDKETVMESARLGICDYILKPFSSNDLEKRIYRAFEQERKKREEEEKRAREEAGAEEN